MQSVKIKYVQHTLFISTLSGFFLLFLVEGVIVVSSPSTVDGRLVHLLDYLLHVSVRGQIMALLQLLGWVVYFPIESLHLSLHIESFTVGRGGTWRRVRFLRGSPTPTQARHTSKSPQATSEDDHQEYCKEECRYTKGEGIMCAWKPTYFWSVCSGVYRVETSQARSQIFNHYVLGTLIDILGFAGYMPCNFGSSPHYEASTY